jgi:hypothetical protein
MANRPLPPVPTAADWASRRPEDPQDSTDHQQDDPERRQDPDVGEPPEQEQDQSEKEHAAASSVDVTRYVPRHSADRTLLVRRPRCQSMFAKLLGPDERLVHLAAGVLIGRSAPGVGQRVTTVMRCRL